MTHVRYRGQVRRVVEIEPHAIVLWDGELAVERVCLTQVVPFDPWHDPCPFLKDRVVPAQDDFPRSHNSHFS